MAKRTEFNYLDRIADALEDIDNKLNKEVFYVAFTKTVESDVTTWSVDKTAAEIIAAVEDGALVVGVFTGDAGTSYIHLLGYDESDGEAVFQEWDVDTNNLLTLRQWTVDADGTTLAEYTVSATPST